MILDTFPCLDIEILERKMKNLDEDLRALSWFLVCVFRPKERREKEMRGGVLFNLGVVRVGRCNQVQILEVRCE